MAEKKKKARIAARVGKNPTAAVDTKLTSTKYRSGGAQVRSKKGGIVRKPVPKIRYKKSSS